MPIIVAILFCFLLCDSGSEETSHWKLHNVSNVTNTPKLTFSFIVLLISIMQLKNIFFVLFVFTKQKLRFSISIESWEKAAKQKTKMQNGLLWLITWYALTRHIYDCRDISHFDVFLIWFFFSSKNFERKAERRTKAVTLPWFKSIHKYKIYLWIERKMRNSDEIMIQLKYMNANQIITTTTS